MSSYAQVCEVGKVKEVLRKVLHLYFTEKNILSLTKDEIKDLLVFYLSISSQNITVDCSIYGTNSNKPIVELMDIGESLPDKIPSCFDGTKYGECSLSKPGYCFAGQFYSKCDICGCPTNSVCGKSGKCERLSQNVTCFKDIDCGQNGFVADYYCANNYISRLYVNYLCLGAGTTLSKCVSTNNTVSLIYCDTNLNQTCVNGQSTCQSTLNQSAMQANQTSSVITIKGRLIDYFSKQPIVNALVYTWDGQTRRDVYTNANGEFTSSVDTTIITPTTSKPFGINPACYNGIGFAVFRNPDNSLYVNVQIDSLIGPAKSFTVSSSELNIGDIPMWPAVDIAINSDIAVKFSLEYSSVGGGGNSNYKTSHYLSYSFPLTVDVRAKLTDISGNVYYSPYSKLGLENGCAPTWLNFSNNQFNWKGIVQTNATQITGICLVRDSYTTVPVFSAPDLGQGYAKMAKPGVNTISGLQSACSQTDFSNLLQTYCTQNSNPIQEQVMTYDSQGNYQSLSCGAFGCNFKNCTATTNQSQACIDSDGDNIYVKGTVTYNGEIFTDHCTGPATHVMEQLCIYDSSGKLLGMSNQQRECLYGCFDGACKTSNQTILTNGSITLIYPNGGEVLQKTKTYTIQWTSQNINPSKSILIWVYQKSTNIRRNQLVNLSNDGNEPWTVSSVFNDANDYEMFVEACDERGVNCVVSDKSDGQFSIVTNLTTLSPTGVCMIRDSSTSMPSFFDSDVGPRYAKLSKPGINDITSLRNACTQTDYKNLLQSYCSSYSAPVMQEVVSYGSGGSWTSSGCSIIGCSQFYCASLTNSTTPSGVCMIRDSSTSIPSFFAPDIGAGYAKLAKPGVNKLTELTNACSLSDYTELLKLYCYSNSNPVQEQVINYGPGGGWNSSTCGAYGCSYVNCTILTIQNASKPDLIIENAYIQPQNVSLGSTFSAWASAKNIGSANAIPPPGNNNEAKFYYYSNVTNFLFGSLSSGQSTGYLQSSGLMVVQALGTNTVRIVVDPFNIVDELNENNNEYFLSFSAASLVNVTCTDSDVNANYTNGKNPFIKGTTTRNDGGIWTDFCVNIGQVQEGYCNSNSSTGVSTIVITCPIGDTCSNGACI